MPYYLRGISLPGRTEVDADGKNNKTAINREFSGK